MYVVQASPISKIYAPEWQQRCIENPEVIAQSSPGLFELRVRRPSGGISLSHMKPVHASTLIKRTGLRKIEEDEITPLVNWLVEHESSDPYGIVSVSVGDQFETAMQEMLAIAMDTTAKSSGVEAKKRRDDIQKGIVDTMNDQLKTARARADERVKKALSVTHNNLLKSWQALQSEGKGTYAPSSAEALGYFVLKAEIDRKLEQNKKLYDSVAAGMPGGR